MMQAYFFLPATMFAKALLVGNHPRLYKQHNTSMSIQNLFFAQAKPTQRPKQPQQQQQNQNIPKPYPCSIGCGFKQCNRPEWYVHLPGTQKWPGHIFRKKYSWKSTPPIPGFALMYSANIATRTRWPWATFSRKVWKDSLRSILIWTYKGPQGGSIWVATKWLYLDPPST